MLFGKKWKDLAAGQSIYFRPIKSLPYTQTNKHLILSGEAASSKQEARHVGQGISVWNMWAPAVCEARPPGNNKYKVGTLPLETLEAYWYILPALGDFNPSEVCNVEAHPVPVNNTPAIETAGSWTYWWCTCSVPLSHPHLILGLRRSYGSQGLKVLSFLIVRWRFWSFSCLSWRR